MGRRPARITMASGEWRLTLPNESMCFHIEDPDGFRGDSILVSVPRSATSLREKYVFVRSKRVEYTLGAYCGETKFLNLLPLFEWRGSDLSLTAASVQNLWAYCDRHANWFDDYAAGKDGKPLPPAVLLNARLPRVADLLPAGDPLVIGA